MRILIADDAVTIRNLLREILSEAGFRQFTFAANGAEALRALTCSDIDLALLDWHMPMLSGLEVLDAVRREGCRTPIIMVTAESSVQSVKEACDAGVDQYVVKPFRQDFLIDKIFRALTISNQTHNAIDPELFASAFSGYRGEPADFRTGTGRLPGFRPVALTA